MRVLLVASEVSPYSKTGGLADVTAALPQALAARGHDVTVVTPRYASVKAELTHLPHDFVLRFPFGRVPGSLSELRLGERLRIVFVESQPLFGRPGIYGEGGAEYGDNDRRYAFFCAAALSAAQLLALKPDVIHLNDWQTGLAAVAHRKGYGHTDLGRAVTVFTIHNLAYMGLYPKRAMGELGLSWDLFTADGLEFYDQLSFLKAGLAYADALTTVSPRYAEEIQTREGGNGLDGFLRARADDLHGILNGVDYAEWNPQEDPLLPARFSANDLAGKARCKAALLDAFHLPAQNGPLFAMVGRLAQQKGIDLILDAVPRALERPCQVVLLGSGEPRYEAALRALAARFPGRVGVRVGFDHALSHLLEAGADFFLMPSLYEPCGLNQMYSLRYATLPIVRATGGLDDTVIDLALPTGTGIKFLDYSADGLLHAMHRALDAYTHPALLDEARRRAMAQDFSWDVAAKGYESLYEELLVSRVRR